ncbi:MAG: LamG-like jellyroll fold domain-containing protein [Halococcoides sp.]
MGHGGQSDRSRSDSHRRYVLIGFVLIAVLAGSALAAVTLFQQDLDPLEGGSIQTAGEILLVESTSLVQSDDTVEALDVQARHNSDHRVACVVSSRLVDSRGQTAASSGDEPFYVGPDRSEGIRLQYDSAVGSSEYMVYRMNASDCRMLGWPMEGVTASRNGSVSDVLAAIEGAPRLAINYSVTPTDRAIETAPTVADDRIVIGDRDGSVRALHAANGTTDWTLSTGGAVNGSVAVDGETAYIGSANGSVRAVWLANGTERWTNTTIGAVEASPTVADGRVLVPTDDGLHALNASDGSGLWTRPTASPVRSAPGERDAVVVAGTDDGTVIAVDARDGSDLWTRSTGDRIRTAPALVNETAFVGSADGTLYAFAESDGATRYAADLGASVSGPAVYNGTVVVGTSAGEVVGLPTTGSTPKWTYDAESEVSATPAIANGTVYAADRDGVVHALDPQTGDLTATNQLNGSISSGAAVLDGAVVVADRSGTVTRITAGERVWRMAGYDATNAGYATLRAPTSTASPDWTVDTGANVTAGAAYVDGTVFAGDVGGTLAALDGTDGSQRWSRSLSGPITGSPAVVDSRVYATDGDRLTALDQADGATLWTATPGGSIPGAPTVADDRVVVGGDALSAYDTSGSLRWQIDAGRIETAPAVADETVLAGTTDGSIWAGDRSGVERWTTATGAPVRVDPAIRKDTVYVGSDADGSPLDWERRLWEAADFDRGRYNATTSDGANATRAGQLSMTYPNGTGDDDVIGHYRLDRDVSGTDGTVYDYSGGDTSGVTVDGITPGAEGVFGTESFNFDADDARIRVPDSANLSLRGSVTVSFWIKTSDLDSTENSQEQKMFVDKGSYASEGFEFLDNGNIEDPSMIYFRVFDGSNNEAGVERSAVNDGSWHHLVGTYDADTEEVAIYLDGAKQDSTTASGYVESSQNLTIGASPGGDIDLTSGNMDEIQLHSRSLSDREVEQLYRYGADGRFEGAYNRTYTTGHTQSWNRLRANVSSLPAGTTANATVTVEDAGGATLGSETVTLSAGATSRDLSVPDGQTARVTVDQTADSAALSPRVENLTLDHERVEATDPCTVCRQAVYDSATAWAQGDSRGASADGAGGLTDGAMRTGYPNGTAGEDLQRYYRFDRAVASTGGTVTDYSARGVDATTENVSTSEGVFGTNASRFENGSAITGTGVAGDQTDLSVSTWYRWESDATSEDDLLAARDAAGNATELRIDESSGSPQFTWQTDSAETGANGLTDVGSVEAGAWNHVGATIERNGSQADYALYHNGTLVDETTADYSPSTAALFVGAMNDSGTVARSFNGSIDETQLYDRVLTDREMAALVSQTDTEIRGNYTDRVTTQEVQRWTSIETSDVTLPTGTAVNVTVTAMAPNGTALGAQTIDLSAGTSTTDLDLPTSRDARIAINGTTADPATTWSIDDLTLSRDRAASSVPQTAVVDSGRQFDRGRYDKTSVDAATGPRGNLSMRYANGTANDALAAFYRMDATQAATRTATTDARAEWAEGTFDASSADAATGDLTGNHSLTYANGTAGDSLRGYYRLDRAVDGSGGTVRDYSGAGFDGTTRDGVTTGETGVFETDAMAVDASNVSFDATANPEPTDALTVSVWVRRDGTQVRYAQPVWHGPDGATDSSWGFQTDADTDSELQFKLDTTDNGDQYLGTATVNDGEWTHLTATYDGSQVTLYRNGDQVDSKTASGSIDGYDDTHGLSIGSNAAGENHWNGSVDELRVYNESLTGTEVSELYRYGSDGTFEGNYSRSIDSADAGEWDTMTIDAPAVPSATTPDVTVQAVDGGTVQDERTVTPGAGTTSYDLSLPDTNTTRIRINGTSSDVTRSWRIDSIELAEAGATVTETIDTSDRFDEGSYNATTSDGATADRADALSMTYANGTASDALAGYWRFDRDIGTGTETTANDTIDTRTDWANGTFDGTTTDAATTLDHLRVGYPNGTSGDDLVHYYRFDGTPSGSSGSVPDYSGNGNTASTVNGVTTDATGVFENGSYSFDGTDDAVDFGSGGQSGSQTVAAWVYLESTGSTMSIASGGTDEYTLGVTSGGNWLYETSAGSNHQTTAPATTGAWVHVAGRINTTSEQLTLWVNGTNASSTDGASISNSGKSNMIGNVDGADEPFDGRIDEVQVYDRALSDAEMRALARGASDGSIEGNYTQTIGTDASAYDELTADVTALDDSTSAPIEVESLDGGTVVDSTTLSPSTTGTSTSDLALASGTDTRVTVNASSTDPAHAPVIDSIALNGTSSATGTVLDYSGNGNDALANGSESGVSGVFETDAHDFDGTDGVEVGRPADLNVTGDLTLSTWANASVADGTAGTVVAKGDQWGLRVNPDDRWELFATNASGTTRVESETIATGAWAHLVGTYDESTGELTFWVNGTQVGTATTSIESSDAAVTIGNSSVADARFDGRIDEVRIDTETVDGPAVDRLYRHGADGTHEGSYRRTFTADGANWSELAVDVPTLPDTATLSVTVETLSDGSVVDSRTVSPGAGSTSYDLALEDAADSRVIVEMTTTDPARSARLDQITLSGPERVRTVTDFGGNGITALKSGDPGSADGLFDTTAATFDGTDDAVVASDPALNLTESFTLAAWARPATLNGTLQPIVTNDDQWAIEIDDTDSWRAAIDSGSGRTTVSGSTATADAWTHLLARYDADSDELALYVNGTLAGTASVGSVNDTDGTVRIGGTETDAFEGRIDEVQVYDRALSTAAISEQYRAVGSAFGGNYTHRVDTDDPQTWSELTVETAALPDDGTLNATVEARDASDSVLGSTTIELSEGTTTRSLALPDSEDLVVTINGTTLAPTETFGVTSVSVEHDRASGPTVSDGELVALDRSDGTARWVYDTGSSVTTSPAVDRSTVYAGLQNGSLLAVNSTDGSLRWTYSGTSLESDPAVVNDTVYLGDSDRVVALDAASGTERWSYTASGPVRAGPVPISDSVFVGANDTGVVSLR